MAATDLQTALADSRKAHQRQSWWQILKTSGSEWVDADAMTWAAAIACYTVLALAPLLVIAVKVLGALLGNQADAVQNIRDNATRWMGTQGADAIAAILDKLVNQKGGLLASIISSGLVVLSVGGVFAEVQQAMNRVWKVKPKPGTAISTFIRVRLTSVVVLAIAAVLLLASVLIVHWLDGITAELGFGLRIVTWSIDVIASLIVLTLIFGMVYRTVPDADIEWKSTGLGSFLSAILFMVGSYGLSLYFKFAAPQSAYGAVGSLAAALIWIYYSAQIALFGAVLTEVYARDRGHGVHPSKHAQFLSECDETETATPSSETPGHKPSALSKESQRRNAPRQPETDYEAVLGPHAPGSAGGVSPPKPARPTRGAMLGREMVVAGAGLAVGALLSAFGSFNRGKSVWPGRKEIAAARLRHRVRTVEQRLDHASRVREYLDQNDVNEQIDAIQRRIRESVRKTK